MLRADTIDLEFRNMDGVWVQYVLSETLSHCSPKHTTPDWLSIIFLLNDHARPCSMQYRYSYLYYTLSISFPVIHETRFIRYDIFKCLMAVCHLAYFFLSPSVSEPSALQRQ